MFPEEAATVAVTVDDAVVILSLFSSVVAVVTLSSSVLSIFCGGLSLLFPVLDFFVVQ